MTGGRTARAAALALMLSCSTFGAAAQTLLDFSDDERRRIAAHGPWPPAPVRDVGNGLSGRAEAIALGERLFSDPRLAIDGRFSCATCHDPRRGLADGRPRALGREILERNTPGLWNVGQHRWFGWDGAADSLWHQSLRALFNPREQAATPAHLQRLVRSDTGYRNAFGRLYGSLAMQADAETTAVRLAKALGAYLATLASPRTAFDGFRDALLRGDRSAAAAYPLAAQRGLRLFEGRAGCAICHIGPLFSNGEFADIGLPFFTRPGVVDPGRHGGILALREGPFSRFNLLGRYNDVRGGRSSAVAVKTRHVEAQHRNFGEFKVPSLREAVHSAPYMHDGSLPALADVVRHYDRIDLERLHADGERILKPLNLSADEAADLVAFVQTLSRLAHRVRFEIDMREAIAAGRFDPARDRLGLRGATPPLAWSRSVPLHEPGGPVRADGVYAAWVEFPRAPRGGQPLAWKAKIDRDGSEGWEQGRNHSLVLDAAELSVRRAFDAPAATPPIRRSGQIVRHAAFASRHVAAREVQVWLPPGYDAASAQNRSYPVLYLHDGQNVFDAAAAGAEWGADEAATALVAGGELPPMIIVAVASGGDRIAEYTPWPGLSQGRSTGGGAAAYARFLVDELKPFIDSRYRTQADAANTAVGGSSLGGLVSMWLLLQHGETFGAGLVVSPSVWWAGSAVVGEVVKVGVREPRAAQRPRIWLDIGVLEGEGALDGARALRDALQVQGWRGAALAYSEDAEGGHDEASWAERFPRMLRFLYGNAGAR